MCIQNYNASRKLLAVLSRIGKKRKRRPVGGRKLLGLQCCAWPLLSLWCSTEVTICCITGSTTQVAQQGALLQVPPPGRGAPWRCRQQGVPVGALRTKLPCMPSPALFAHSHPFDRRWKPCQHV